MLDKKEFFVNKRKVMLHKKICCAQKNYYFFSGLARHTTVKSIYYPPFLIAQYVLKMAEIFAGRVSLQKYYDDKRFQ